MDLDVQWNHSTNEPKSLSPLNFWEAMLHQTSYPMAKQICITKVEIKHEKPRQTKQQANILKHVLKSKAQAEKDVSELRQMTRTGSIGHIC
jgi:hypothetical protein